MKTLNHILLAAVMFIVALAVFALIPATAVPTWAHAKQAAERVVTDLRLFFAGLVAAYTMRASGRAYAFQSAVALNQGFGVVGEIVFEGPTRAQPVVIKHATAADIVVGRAFTLDASDNTARPGGTGVFAGILSNPKGLQSIGTQAGGPLAPTLVVPTGTVGEFSTMDILLVSMLNAAAIGNDVMFDNTTGELSALAPSTFTGVIAVTTGVLTVSGINSEGSIGPGSKITGTGVPAGTYVTAVLTGTGGNGTYQTNIVTAVASFANGSATSVAPAGKTLIEDAKVVRYANAAAGLTVVSLTGA